MQRFFIDFGTGTSLDSVYYVISVDTTIGKDAFKTDLKLGYGQGFASYMSINQQLSMMAANVAAAVETTNDELTVIADNINNTDDNISDKEILIELTRVLTEATAAGVAITEDVKEKIKAELAKVEETIKAAAAAEVENAKRKLAALIPGTTLAKINDAKAEIKRAEAKLMAVEDQVLKVSVATSLAEKATLLGLLAPEFILQAATEQVAVAAAPPATTA